MQYALRLPLSLSLILTSGCCEYASAQPSLKELGGLLPSYGQVEEAYAINSVGNAVGTSAGRAVLYAAGSIVDLSTIAPTSIQPIQAWGINSSGQIVGLANVKLSETGSTQPHAFRLSNGLFVDLGTFGGAFSVARGINDGGQVAGVAELPDHTTHGFVTAVNGSLIDVGTFGGPSSGASAINNNGQVVGAASLPNLSEHAFVWANGSKSDLTPLLPITLSTVATAINNSGDVVGALEFSPYKRHAVLWSNGEMNDLGTFGGDLSVALGINSLGQVVGYASTSINNLHAFIYTAGKMFDLNALLPPHSGWELMTAYAISDNGDIVGGGWHNGILHSYLLHVDATPIFQTCDNTSNASPLTFIKSANCICDGPQTGDYGWPHAATVNVYITPQFSSEERDAIQQSFINWSVENLRNGAEVQFLFSDVPVSGNLTYIVQKGTVSQVSTEPTAFQDTRTVLSLITTTDPHMPPNILMAAMAHEIGHFLGLDHCTDCSSGSTVMRGVAVINGDQYIIRGATSPTLCDDKVVHQFYGQTVVIF